MRYVCVPWAQAWQPGGTAALSRAAIMHHAPAPPSLHPFHRVVSGLASSIIEADEAETFAKREAKKKGNSESRVHDNNKAGGKMDEFMGDWS